MWRKPTDAKPSETKPSSAKPSSLRPDTPTAPVSSAPVTRQVEPLPVAATPVPAPAAAPSAPVYIPPPAKVAVHDTSAGTSIASGLKIRGELTGSSDLYIDGDVQGKINLAGSRVTVGPNGRIQADIEAGEIVVEGTVHGNLKARDSVRLGSSSKVEGSILTPRIGVDDGARLRSKVEMTRPTKSSQSSASTETSDYNVVSAARESE